MVDTGPIGPIKNLCCGTSTEHKHDCWTLYPTKLPWWPGWWKAFWIRSPFPQRRCTARSPKPGIYAGRCELTEHEEYIDHALERGMYTPRWRVEWTA